MGSWSWFQEKFQKEIPKHSDNIEEFFIEEKLSPPVGINGIRGFWDIKESRRMDSDSFYSEVVFAFYSIVFPD
jgi:hypothetical protein